MEDEATERRRSFDRRLERLEEKVADVPVMAERIVGLRVQLQALSNELATTRTGLEADIRASRAESKEEFRQYRGSVARWVSLGVAVGVPSAIAITQWLSGG